MFGRKVDVVVVDVFVVDADVDAVVDADVVDVKVQQRRNE